MALRGLLGEGAPLLAPSIARLGAMLAFWVWQLWLLVAAGLIR